MEACLIVLMLLFLIILVICLLSIANTNFEVTKDKKKANRYFVDVDYRNSLFYEEKDEHHL